MNWKMYKYIKRIIDFLVALLMMPIVLLVIIVSGIGIKLTDGGPIIYQAKRRGIDGTIFNMYKIRTMYVNAPDIRNADNSTFNSKNDSRVTPIGKILRKTSLDELAQIINVLKGDMSLIGPRPITIDKPVNEYDEKRIQRLKVRPGITGYTQAFFRNSITQEQKFEYDAWYASHYNFWLDLKIVFKTLQTIIMQKNVYSEEKNGK
ncbi:sugar transferase [Enterococcus dispar]|uniref:sugar transferase n=1 Tax=Enterococcus dispar TaxID=44009 RepID=UPI00232B6B24|nr:sugar transferase [Enterococcus dispar]WCG34070.1 sugar transferase [Enterococcus dispar]